MLRQVDEYRNARLVRSRDPAILDKQDIVIDVGGVYDHEKRRYDHHQRNYDDRFDGGDGEARCTKLSASGLVYRHYGKEVIRSHYPCLQDEVLDMVYVKLYNRLLEALDAIDTGVEMIPKTIRRRRRHPPLKNGEFATTKGSNNNNENDDDEYEEIEIMVEPLWRDSTGLSSRVSRLNPRWNEEDFHGDQPCPDDRFEMASTICGEEFLSHLTVIVESDLLARQFVEQGVLMRKGVDTSGEIVTLPNGGLPWKNHLYELEKKHAIDPLVKFVLYTDQGGMWRVQAVTVKGKNFENRLGLPEGWRGVRDTDLTRIAGIPGCRFCHAARADQKRSHIQ